MPVRLGHRELVLAFFVVCAAATVLMAPRLFVLFDEAYNLNLISTLAREGVYASRTADGYRLLDPAVSTGPTLVVPLAVVLRVWGASIGVVRWAMAGALLLSLACVLWSARELAGREAVLLFMPLFFVTPMILVYGLSVLGDVTALTFGLAALALMSWGDRGTSARRGLVVLVGSGLCLALSVLAKEHMLLLVAAVGLAGAVHALSEQHLGRRHMISRLVPAAVAVVVVAAWQMARYIYIYRFAAPGDLAAWQRTTSEMNSVFWSMVVFDPLSHLETALIQGLDYFGPFPLVLVVIVPLAILARLPAWPSVGRLTGPSLGHTSLVVAVVVWVFWYYIISGARAYNRHLLPAVVFSELLATGVAVRAWWAGWRRSKAGGERPEQARVWATVLAVVLAVLMLWSGQRGLVFNRMYMHACSVRLPAQMAVVRWVQANTPADAALSGWGWFVPWHVAFLAQRTPAEIRIGRADLPGLTDWFVYIPEIPWTGSEDDGLRGFLARQGEPVFVQREYRVYRVTWRPANP